MTPLLLTLLAALWTIVGFLWFASTNAPIMGKHPLLAVALGGPFAWLLEGVLWALYGRDDAKDT